MLFFTAYFSSQPLTPILFLYIFKAKKDLKEIPWGNRFGCQRIKTKELWQIVL